MAMLIKLACWGVERTDQFLLLEKQVVCFHLK